MTPKSQEREIAVSNRLISAARIAEELSICRRTLGRWIADKSLAFPRPVVINKRLYILQAEFDDWKRAQINHR